MAELTGVKEDAVHELDEKAATLKTDFRYVERESTEFKIVNDYVQNGHGPTHKNYRLKIKDLFAVAREGEEDYTAGGYHMDPNRQLLCRGSKPES